MTPTVVSHYRLLNRLGEGGMGVVYRAEDETLGREVAVKLLRTEAVTSDEWLARFEREARLASSLQHPHICTIHELGEHDGQPFIVMELLEGRTIKQFVEDGPLPPARVVDFAIQVAEALEAAHRRGIIHRDIKPANLFVTHGDRVKVLDFGLAKLATDAPSPAITAPSAPTLTGIVYSPDLTRTGSTVGTASYMAPEQAQGQPVDARTDLFSLGAVLYEMVTARRAFGGEDIPLIVMKIINGIIVAPHTIVESVPPRLEAIILKLMAVDPNNRYQSATELLTELRSASEQLARDAQAGKPRFGGPRTPATGSKRRLIVRIGAAAAVVAAGVAVSAVWRARHTAALTDRDSIVIGQFDNATTDPVFDETLLTALKVHLGQSPFLDIITDQRITETLESMNRPASTRLTHDVTREVCQRLGVKAMLEGAIATLGTHYVVTLTATDCDTGDQLARTQTEATSKERVLAELGTISSSMRTRLGESLPSMQRFDVPIEQVTTPSLPALKAYTLGLEERRRGRELESVAFFNQALENDREFASAYTTLSTVYGSLGEWRRSEEYARLANSVTRKVSERERLFITYQFHDRVTGNQERAAETLELWKAAYPRDSRPPNALALIHNRVGRYEQAIAEAQEALRRSPGHPFPLSNLSFAYRALGRYEEARTTAQQAVKLGIETTPTRRLLYQIGLMLGDGTADAHLIWAKGKPREFDLVSAQAQAASFRGRLHEATDLYQRAIDLAVARGLSGTASGYAAQQAWTEAISRDPRQAVPQIRATLGRIESEADAPGTVPRFRAGVAYALAGLTSEAQGIAADAQQRYPESTFTRTLLVPTIRAGIALQRKQPDQALQALEGAVATQTGTVAGLVPFYMRGEAYLQKRAYAAAQQQFEGVMANRGVDPMSPVVPLAQLGIARAKAGAGDTTGARQAYEELFKTWQTADADFAPLLAAKAEYAALQPGS
jgi:tetratricopeptide (TPR) repeat protein/predicted Ser/Thr protein kinase